MTSSLSLLPAWLQRCPPPPSPPRLSAAAFDEDDVAGHPDGEPLPLPKNVNWSIEKAQVAATPRRRRLTLAGPWRFAAMPAPDVSPQRAEMGWLNMPAKSPPQWEISDSRRKASRANGPANRWPVIPMPGASACSIRPSSGSLSGFPGGGGAVGQGRFVLAFQPVAGVIGTRAPAGLRSPSRWFTAAKPRLPCV